MLAAGPHDYLRLKIKKKNRSDKKAHDCQHQSFPHNIDAAHEDYCPYLGGLGDGSKMADIFKTRIACLFRFMTVLFVPGLVPFNS